MSPRNRLYFKVGNLRCRNLSRYGNFLKDIISFVALFCTFSIFSISPFLNGYYTELEYSKCGLTIALYSKTKVLLSICMKFLLMTPKTLNALLIFSFMCCPKFSLESPRENPATITIMCVRASCHKHGYQAYTWNSTQLNSMSMYGRRCQHLNVRIYLTQLHTKLLVFFYMY